MILCTSPQARASKRVPIVMALVAPNVLSIKNAITMGTRLEARAWETAEQKNYELIIKN